MPRGARLPSGPSARTESGRHSHRGFQMHLRHFGDSYDIVKKSLLGWLGAFGPWAAHPMFTHEVTEEDANAFSSFLGVPLISKAVLLPSSDRRAYLAACGNNCKSVFLDPDTGVRLHPKRGKRAPEFLFGDEIEAIAAIKPQGLVLTFDQSLARGSEAQQIREKLGHFKSHEIHGFAYVSHASFMVLGQSANVVATAKEDVARKSGLPAHRIVGASA